MFGDDKEPPLDENQFVTMVKQMITLINTALVPILVTIILLVFLCVYQST